MEYKNIYYALFGLIALVFWSVDFWKVLKKPEINLPTHGQVKSGVRFLKLVVYLIGLFGWFLISYSLTGPRLAREITPQKIEVNDLYFVVDVSRSMLAEDFRPNRLEVAKEKIREFVKLKPADRIGIVMFSEKAFTLLPLTTDLKLIEQLIADISVGALGSGTAMGDALGLAVARAATSAAENKVIVLLTDGVNNVGNLGPIDAAKMAKENSIKVYSIGIGGDPNANLPGYRMIPGGSIDLKTLKKISDLTGGKSFFASNERALERVLTDINKLEKTEIEVKSQVVYQELFYQYLFYGVILFVLAELLRKFVLREVL
jgi:Ca-activated chloride channel family protein